MFNCGTNFASNHYHLAIWPNNWLGPRKLCCPCILEGSIQLPFSLPFLICNYSHFLTSLINSEVNRINPKSVKVRWVRNPINKCNRITINNNKNLPFVRLKKNKGTWIQWCNITVCRKWDWKKHWKKVCTQSFEVISRASLCTL